MPDEARVNIGSIESPAYIDAHTCALAAENPDHFLGQVAGGSTILSEGQLSALLAYLGRPQQT
ncbi:MAG: hypothetical protein A2804_01145 [Candidatus Pacebacteria bacterium RIFCSPHIGHO2_01_FULL_46_10]|nr:MAG: hypothetical protein A2804_01145 [Candidatus Pacebacteria bacterium RIFCSPHIGHO2_01_FULL_46_10]